MPLSASQTAHVLAELIEVRDQVRSIVPGGRDPTHSYHAKGDALKLLDRLIGDDLRGLSRQVRYDHG